MVALTDVPAPTRTSLFMQPRSAKVTRRVKFDCQMSELQEFLISFLILLLVEEEEKQLVYLQLRGPWRGKPVTEPTAMLSILLLLLLAS